jgi:flagellar basal-body rod protein FlgB
MTIQDLGLLRGIGAKMDYLNQRQSVIAQNIANADTPGYRPKDMEKEDFSTVLGSLGGGKNVTVVSTNDKHLPNAQGALSADAEKQKKVYEVAPVGNSVIIEEQLMHSGQTMTDYNMMLNLYQKQVSMFRIALGTR